MDQTSSITCLGIDPHIVETVLINASLQQILFVPKDSLEIALPIDRPISTVSERYRALIGRDHPCDEIRPPCQWVESGTRGIVVRVYGGTNSDSPLIHLRALTRMTSVNSSAILTNRRSWLHMSWYKGLTVPFHILEDVYRIAGQSLEILEGGRQLELPQTAWSTLDKWRNQHKIPRKGLSELRHLMSRVRRRLERNWNEDTESETEDEGKVKRIKRSTTDGKRAKHRDDEF